MMPSVSPSAACAKTYGVKENSMETQFETLEAQALQLTISERARLAERLIASLDEDTEIEEAWAVEVERRIADIDSGRAKMIPADEAIARAREFLK
jgi:putative addiction module component (TIGR02574 family)